MERRVWMAMGMLGAMAGCDSPHCVPPPPPTGTTVHVVATRPECEGLDVDDGGCLLPWPSSRFLADDRETPSGRRIALPVGAMPTNVENVPVALDAWNERDGFSPMTSMIARVSGDVPDGALVSWRHVEQSLLASAHTVLLDTTGATPVRVAHFSETQPDDGDDAHTTIYVRPAARLAEEHHYVVAIVGLTGVTPSATFAALRDQTPTDAPAVEARRSDFECDVFWPLSRAGVDRSSVVLAWDFWTGSGENLWGDLVAMRDDAMAQVDELHCSLEAVQPMSANPNARLIAGRLEVPYFLDTPCTDGWLADLDTDGFAARDGNGRPTSNGRRCLVPFYALLPGSIAGDADGSVHVVQYGHGLGNRGHELDTLGVLAPILEATHSIGIATDFIGLSAFLQDQTEIGGALVDLSGFGAVDRRVMQGIIAQLVLRAAFRERCAPLIDDGSPGFRASMLSSGPVRWVGNSEGGILGPTVAALAPESARYDRLALGVGGISYPVMLPRSCDWTGPLPVDAPVDAPPPPGLVLEGAYPSHLDRDLLMVMFATHWDLYEGATYAPHVTGVLPPLPGSATTLPGVLFQTGVNDLGTPEVAGEIAARTMNLPFLASSATVPFGLRAAGSMPTSAFVSFRFDDAPAPPDPPTTDEALCASNAGVITLDPHERVRRDPAAQMQIESFFETGRIP